MALLKYNRIEGLFNSASEAIISEGLLDEPEEMTSFYSTFHVKDGDMIDVLNEHGLEGEKFLDLGSGAGLPMLLANLGSGMIAYGIEARLAMHDASKRVFSKIEKMRNKKHVPELECYPYLGNFFPDDFEASSQERWSSVRSPPDYLSGVDPYMDMGLVLGNFKVIYCYQYTWNLPGILRFVSERASPGTLVINPYDQVRQILNMDIPGNMKDLKDTRVALFEVQ